MTGFGSMMLAEHRGMGSLGLVMTMSVGFCFLAVILVLPLILAVMDLRKERRGQVQNQAPEA
jgi:hypothetical protein